MSTTELEGIGVKELEDLPEDATYVRFASPKKQRNLIWAVRARNDRYVVMTTLNDEGEPLATILDLQQRMRGPLDDPSMSRCVFDDECEKVVKGLTDEPRGLRRDGKWHADGWRIDPDKEIPIHLMEAMS